MIWHSTPLPQKNWIDLTKSLHRQKAAGNCMIVMLITEQFPVAYGTADSVAGKHFITLCGNIVDEQKLPVSQKSVAFFCVESICPIPNRFAAAGDIQEIAFYNLRAKALLTFQG